MSVRVFWGCSDALHNKSFTLAPSCTKEVFICCLLGHEKGPLASQPYGDAQLILYYHNRRQTGGKPGQMTFIRLFAVRDLSLLPLLFLRDTANYLNYSDSL